MSKHQSSSQPTGFPPARSPQTDLDTNLLSKMFKALGNPNRLRLFNEIRGAGQSVHRAGHDCLLNHVIDRLNIGAPTISHHLKELVNAGLVITEKDGKFVRCRVNAPNLAAVAQFFSGPPNASDKTASTDAAPNIATDVAPNIATDAAT